MRYLISYDLVTPGLDYQPLWNALAAISAQRVLLSQWIARCADTSAGNLRDYIRSFVDTNDRVLVTCLDSADWAGWNLMIQVNAI